MNGQTEGMTRRILAEEIKDKLAEIKKLSACILDQSRSIRDFFLGEPPGTVENNSLPKGSAGYFDQIKNGLDDVRGFLKESMESLITLSKEIGVDGTKVSERPEQRG